MSLGSGGKKRQQRTAVSPSTHSELSLQQQHQVTCWLGVWRDRHFQYISTDIVWHKQCRVNLPHQLRLPSLPINLFGYQPNPNPPTLTTFAWNKPPLTLLQQTVAAVSFQRWWELQALRTHKHKRRHNSKGIYLFQKQPEGEHLTLPAGQPTHQTSPHPIHPIWTWSLVPFHQKWKPGWMVSRTSGKYSWPSWPAACSGTQAAQRSSDTLFFLGCSLYLFCVPRSQKDYQQRSAGWGKAGKARTSWCTAKGRKQQVEDGTLQ